MSLILSGTDGLSDVDGSATTPAIRGTDANTGIFFSAADTIDFAEGGVATGQFDSSGNFKFNSGYGSVATAYGCRAWVNFNGTGTVAIRASGNVSSITDNGTGDYTVNFTTAMTDANYSIVATGYFPSGAFGFFTNNNASYLTASSARIETVTHTGATASTDFSFSCVAVFR
jgi:hypothetical protein